MARAHRRRTAPGGVERRPGRPRRQDFPPAPSAAPWLRALAAPPSRRDGDPAERSADVGLCLPSPDWLANRLIVSGPQGELALFLAAGAGPGVVPWAVDPHGLAEAWFNCMMTVRAQSRGISVAGARTLAERLSAAAAAWDAMMRDERRARGHPQKSEGLLGDPARACPLDLHALIPMPADLLARGPEDPAAIAWMWAHWGTTLALRHVALGPAPARPRLRQGESRVRFDFYSADWSPWPALAHMRARWPGLVFTLRPDYDGAGATVATGDHAVPVGASSED
jgi:hypothetical protein